MPSCESNHAESNVERAEKGVEPVSAIGFCCSFLKLSTQPEDSASLKIFRGVCEQALSIAGLHIALGSSLWEAYR